MSESVNCATQHNTKTLKYVVVCLCVLFTANSSDVSQPIMMMLLLKKCSITVVDLIPKCDSTLWTVQSHRTKTL